MKQKTIWILLTGIIIMVSACKKQLNLQPYSTLSKESVFSDESGLKNATLGVYSAWATSNLVRFSLAESGHRYATIGMFGYVNVDPYYRFAETSNEAGIARVWRELYTVISRANSVIDNAETAVDGSVAKTYIAEAKLLRAYAYFNLIRNFGGVPIINHEISSIDAADKIYAPRATLEEVYQFIIADLQFSESFLPDQWTEADLGRVSAATAKCLLGKVYLNMAGKPLENKTYYQKAIDKLNEVVGTSNETKYNIGLLPVFSDVFSSANSKNKEIILSFGYYFSTGKSAGNLYPFYLFPQGLTDGDEQTMYGLTYEFYKLFEGSDTRRDYTMIDRYVSVKSTSKTDSIIYDPNQRYYIKKADGVVVGNKIYRCGLAYGKLPRDKRPTGSTNGYNADQIEIRFSDILLCLAEALNETNQTQQALPLLNRVRSRAHTSVITSTNQDDIRRFIRRERRLELTGEFNTVYDIRRWGTLSEEIAAMSPLQIQDGGTVAYAQKLELYPIPLTEIYANPNLTQNPGW